MLGSSSPTLQCTGSGLIYGYGTNAVHPCGDQIKGAIASSSSSADWDAPETKTFFGFIDTVFYRVYTIAGDLDTYSNCNDCSWTASGSYSAFGEEKFGSTFYWRII